MRMLRWSCPKREQRAAGAALDLIGSDIGASFSVGASSVYSALDATTTTTTLLTTHTRLYTLAMKLAGGNDHAPETLNARD